MRATLPTVGRYKVLALEGILVYLDLWTEWKRTIAFLIGRPSLGYRPVYLTRFYRALCLGGFCCCGPEP